MKRYYYILLGCLIISLTSCDKSLEKFPLDYPSSETFLSNESEVQMAIVGVHSIFDIKEDATPYPIAYEMSSDIGSNRDMKPEQFVQSQTSGHLNTLWEYMYKGIYRCNFILENIDRAGLSDEKLAVYRAQARVLRAYCYYWLTAMFGDVPFIDHTLTMEEAFVGRDPKAGIIDFIIKECDEAAPALQQENQPNTMAMTKGLAWAIKARTALYNERWNDAIAACDSIMALEGTEYILEPEYGDITMLKGKTSKEIIWAIQYNQDDKYQMMPSRMKSRLAGGYSNNMPVQALVDSYECLDGKSIDESPMYDPQHPWENRDPRLGKTVALPGSIFFGYQYETNKDSTKCWNYNVTPPVRINNTDATHAYASYSGYSWRKWCDPAEYRTDGHSSINAIVFRYADVLLMYAEAKIEANQIDQSVYDALNKVRKRAGMPEFQTGMTQQALREAVRKERKYELAGEGVRLFDIRRWKIAERLMNGPCYGRVPKGYPTTTPDIDEYGNPDYTNFAEKSLFGTKLGTRFFDPKRDYLSPIPFSERQINPNLTQNPGY